PSSTPSFLTVAWMSIELADPLPFNSMSDALASVLVIGGMVAGARRKSREMAIVLAWVLTPCAMLVLVHTTHFMNSRYIIAALPMVLVTAVIGVPALLPGALRAARPSAWRAICAAVMALLLVLNIQGIRAYASGSNPAGPLKPDWRGATRLFRQSA